MYTHICLCEAPRPDQLRVLRTALVRHERGGAHHVHDAAWLWLRYVCVYIYNCITNIIISLSIYIYIYIYREMYVYMYTNNIYIYTHIIHNYT